MNEFCLIDRLIAGLPQQAEGLLCGVGDDCAVLAGDGRRDWLVSTDHCIEGVHFRPEWIEWQQLGRKAVLAAVSDIAAMGGRPRFLVVALAIAKSMEAVQVEACYRGIRDVAQSTGMVIIGGDMAESRGGFCSTLTVIGDVVHGRALYRRGARPGDAVYVTGALGAAALGVRRLQHGDITHAAIRRLCEPPCRMEAGQWLASTGCVSAMIDVSDGLVSDLRHISRLSGVGMRLDALRVPLDPTLAHEIDDGTSDERLRLALTGGEDYELAFTVAGPRASAFRQFAAAAERTLGHPLTRIGEVVAGTDVVVLDATGRPITIGPTGFSHQCGGAA